MSRAYLGAPILCSLGIEQLSKSMVVFGTGTTTASLRQSQHQIRSFGSENSATQSPAIVETRMLSGGWVGESQSSGNARSRQRGRTRLPTRSRDGLCPSDRFGSLELGPVSESRRVFRFIELSSHKLKNISLSQNSVFRYSSPRPVPSRRGDAHRHVIVGRGMRWPSRRSVGLHRAKRPRRTAKSCGPGAATLASIRPACAGLATGAIKAVPRGEHV
jgi:hypothetical protein